MKHFLAVFLISISTYCFAQSEIDSMVTRTYGLLEKYKTKNCTETEKTELKNNAFYFQNLGFVLEENNRDDSGALVQIHRALYIWASLGDTLNVANLRKYKGFLLGKINRFPEAEFEAREAIRLFTLKEKDWGVAVSQFDLSRIYEYENNFDSAFYYSYAALKYWNSKSDTSRILIINNELINLCLKTNNLQKAEQIQSESEKLLNKKNLYWLPLIDFYFLSNKLFEKNKSDKAFKKYKKRYDRKIKELKKEGINARSSYDLN